MIGLMVVDDEEGVRRSLRKVFERDDYAVYVAEDGMHAIEMVRNNPNMIETIISDYKMPGIDGLETLTEIGKLNPEITRIMLTGYATIESAIESVNEGIDGFLTKPFSNIEIRAKVQEYNLRKRLKQFVSQQVLEEMQKTKEHITLKRQKVTILFCDIRGFTELSETLTSEALSEILNAHYFSPLDSIVCKHNGTLDKHIGDGIMGIFGAPVSREDDAIRAVRCARNMISEMEKINEKGRKNKPRIDIGIGIATGEVMAGMFGSSRKKEYTVFGLPVNIAARLEPQAKAGQVLICDAVYSEVRNSIQARKIAPLKLKGIGRNIDIYEVAGEEIQKSPLTFSGD